MTRLLKGLGYATAAFALAFALAPVDAARADVVYTYTGAEFTHGNDPFSTADKVIGTITFATPLAANLNLASVTPVSFTFTAGVESLTNLTYNPSSGFSHLFFSTDASGNITGWNIDVAVGGGGDIHLWNAPNQGLLGDQATVGAFFVGDSKYVPGEGFGGVNQAGQFTLTAAVPEPSTWAMMMLGFCGLGFMTYRRKASALRAA